MIPQVVVLFVLALGASSECPSEDDVDEVTSLLQVHVDWNRSRPGHLHQAVEAGLGLASRLAGFNKSKKAHRHRRSILQNKEQEPPLGKVEFAVIKPNHTGIDQPQVSDAIGVAKAHLQNAQMDLQKGLKQAKDGVKNTLHAVRNELLGSVQEVWQAGKEAMKGVAEMGAGLHKTAKVSSEAISASKEKSSEISIGKSLAEASLEVAKLPQAGFEELAGLVSKAQKPITEDHLGDKAHANTMDVSEEAMAFAKGMEADSAPAGEKVSADNDKSSWWGKFISFQKGDRASVANKTAEANKTLGA
eukprot:gnl/TRDRNA2_/TRDRNA2_183512_c0_seq1.p1 gnl/TRDRNA2_/TRDRNA2_183512_c0~~gnl/TRDRNA2_/TRDRNA2_183512_c0_seq1.p1  ORF type:complete len:303 (-),score=63.79 gnl/TRDRNA2_/TRDRNA2_183512_c0_seq1:65-973(-)